MHGMKAPVLLVAAVLIASVAVAVVTLNGPSTGPATATGDNSITSPDTAWHDGQRGSLVLDSSGYPVVSYWEGLPNWDLKVLRCNDPNCANGDDSVEAVDTDGWDGLDSSLALDTSGYPVVSYSGDNADLKVLHCNDANCDPDVNGAESITVPDTGGDNEVAAGTSLVLDSSGYPVISYVDYTKGDLKVLHCDDPNCVGNESSNITTHDSGNVLWGHSMALDASGFPVVAYWGGNADLKVMHCNDVDCSGSNESITSPDTGGEVGRGPSLALDGVYPVISYVDGTNSALKVMRCGNANCTSGNSITSHDAGSVDTLGSTSLALDGSNPVVSYRDHYTHKLKVMRCNDTNCAGDDESVTSPDTADTGSSLALDSSGYPVVSYFGSSGGTHYLKLLHCGDANCTVKDVPPPAIPCPVSPNLPFPDPGCDSYDVSFSLTASITLPAPLTVTCTGTASLMAYREQNPLDPRRDKDDDTLRDMDVEILYAHGNGICQPGNLVIVIDLSATPTTTGQIEEQTKGQTPSDPFLPADSSFDAYFEINSVTVGRVLHNNAPFSMECKITLALGMPPEGCVYTLSLGAGAPGAAAPPPGIALLNASDAQVGTVTGMSLTLDWLDSDLDGCTDVAEGQSKANASTGGGRDPENFWDFYDVVDASGEPPGDGVVDLMNDIFALADRFDANDNGGAAGINRNSSPLTTAVPAAPAYHPLFDRDQTLVGPNPWNLGPPDGIIDLMNDIFHMADQFDDNCQ